jgi:hypothetical protein
LNDKIPVVWNHHVVWYSHSQLSLSQVREKELKDDKRSLKLELKELELAHEDFVRNLKDSHDKQMTHLRGEFEQQAKELQSKYEKKMKNLREELEGRRKLEIHEVTNACTCARMCMG